MPSFFFQFLYEQFFELKFLKYIQFHLWESKLDYEKYNLKLVTIDICRLNRYDFILINNIGCSITFFAKGEDSTPPSAKSTEIHNSWATPILQKNK